MASKTLEINHSKIQTCLLQIALSEKDHLKKNELMAAMNRLEDQPFDQETFQQLWDQCKLNSKGEVKVQEFMEYVQKAEVVLVEGIRQVDVAIGRLENEKPDPNEISEQSNYKETLNHLYEEKEQIRLNLRLIRRPFQQLSRQTANSLQKHQTYPGEENEDGQERLFEYDPDTAEPTLSRILEVTLLLLAVSWLGSQSFNQFLDMTLCLVIVMGYVLQTVSRKIIRLNLMLLTASLCLDLLWLGLYSGSFWNPPKNYEYPRMATIYLRCSICLVVLGQLLKLLLIYYYLTLMQINEFQTYSFSLFNLSFNIKPQPHPPVPSSHPLAWALLPIFNRPPPQAHSPSSSPAIPISDVLSE